jgi:hypothetical protein
MDILDKIACISHGFDWTGLGFESEPSHFVSKSEQSPAKTGLESGLELSP